jgi:hypothetical protein
MILWHFLSFAYHLYQVISGNKCGIVPSTMSLAISILSMPYFSLLILGLLDVIILDFRSARNMNNNYMEKKKMSYATSGRKMKFYEDFYAVTVVSYIYYEDDEILKKV